MKDISTYPLGNIPLVGDKESPLTIMEVDAKLEALNYTVMSLRSRGGVCNYIIYGDDDDVPALRQLFAPEHFFDLSKGILEEKYISLLNNTRHIHHRLTAANALRLAGRHTMPTAYFVRKSALAICHHGITTLPMRHVKPLTVSYVTEKAAVKKDQYDKERG